MPTIRKLIDLDTDVVKVLSIQAIEQGHKSLKSYIEYLAIERAKSVHLGALQVRHAAANEQTKVIVDKLKEIVR